MNLGMQSTVSMSPIPRTRVAVIDDDDLFLSSVMDLLSSRGFNVRGFSNAADLFSALDARHEFEVYIVDYKLPGINGMELFMSIKQRNLSASVIFLSGYGNIPTAVAAIKAGAIEYLEKPFNPNKLIDLVCNCSKIVEETRRESVQIFEFIARYERLPTTQKKVMNLAIQGLTSKEIARELSLSVRTVDTYRMWIMERTGVGSFAELVRLATLMDSRNRQMIA